MSKVSHTVFWPDFWPYLQSYPWHSSDIFWCLLMFSKVFWQLPTFSLLLFVPDTFPTYSNIFGCFRCTYDVPLTYSNDFHSFIHSNISDIFSTSPTFSPFRHFPPLCNPRSCGWHINYAPPPTLIGNINILSFLYALSTPVYKPAHSVVSLQIEYQLSFYLPNLYSAHFCNLIIF